MKRIAIAELEGAALDWAVAAATWPGGMSSDFNKLFWEIGFKPTTDWSQCGPLIERYKVEMYFHEEYVANDGKGPTWEAMLTGERLVSMGDYDPIGKTPLIAACRAIVAAHNPSGFVEVPDELVENE